MVSRNLSGYLDRKCLLTSWRLAPAAWSLVSHKVLRWATPLFQFLMFFSNLVLAVYGIAVIWLWVQAAFYAAAAIGWLLVITHRRASVFSAPFAFCVASAGFFFGILRCFRRERITVY
jgi:hypothetical protein